jgi:DNA-binding HxlR family transcriptional regulator
MSPPHSASADLGPAPTVTRILRDPTNRLIIATLAEERDLPLDVAGLQAHALPDAPVRFLRDRLRQLAESGVVEREAEPTPRTPGATATWVLTPAGRDLHRIHAVIVRIVTRAGAARVTASGHRQDLAVEIALDALADPPTLKIVQQLAAAGDPMDPDALEAACHPVTRRTLYRRLRILQDEGLVDRLVTHEVPRRTHYALHDRWRPVAGVLLLAAWWELRHGAGRAPSFDLPLLLHLVAPVAKSPRGRDGLVSCTVTAPETPDAVDAHVRLRVGDGGLRLPAPEATDHDAAISGTPLAWAAALVTDARGELTISGDADLADALITSARAALLAYVR